MDKQKIIKILLENGFQTNESVLNILIQKPGILTKIISSPSKPTMITEDLIKQMMTQPHVIRSKSIQHQIKIEDLHNHLKQKYEFLKKTILETYSELEDLISINKINEKTKTFSIVGIVSETDGSLILEDSTGTEHFELENTQPLTEDEIIGVIGVRENGKNFVKKIIYPDIPLKRTISKTENEGCIIFTSNITPKDRKSYEIFLRNIEEKPNNKVIFLNDFTEPDITQIRKDTSQNETYFVTNNFVDPSVYTDPVYLEINNLKILLTTGKFLEYYKKKWNISTEETIITLVQKRDLNPTTEDNTDTIYLLDIIPDIIIIGGLKEIINTNYKGTTILTTGNLEAAPMYWLLNTKTRETFKSDIP